MYQFSRSLYRTLTDDLVNDARSAIARQRLLGACEETMGRLAADRHYFARPVRFLFTEVRDLFPMAAQARVYREIERHLALAIQYVDTQAAEGRGPDGRPLACQATTRRGTSCQRIPLPGHRYCPSHRHLEDGYEAVVDQAA